MNKKLLSLVLTICITLTCVISFSACNGSSSDAPEFYNKTFVLEKFSVDYENVWDNTATFGEILEENLAHIDWKNTIVANDSTIDSTTFKEEVTTLARAKEIIATFGKSMYGMKITFASKDAKTATATLGDDVETLTVDDFDSQGINAAFTGDDGTDAGRITLNYNDKTNEIEYLDFLPVSARYFTLYFDEEVQIAGTPQSSIAVTAEFHLVLQK